MQDIASELTAAIGAETEAAFSVSTVFEYLKLFDEAALRYRMFFGKEIPGRRYIPEIRQASREFYSGNRFLFGIPSQGIRDGPGDSDRPLPR